MLFPCSYCYVPKNELINVGALFAKRTEQKMKYQVDNLSSAVLKREYSMFKIQVKTIFSHEVIFSNNMFNFFIVLFMGIQIWRHT